MVKADEWQKKIEKELETARENGQVPDSFIELVSELRIYQAELEMQNEELMQSPEELALLYRDYYELYNNVPVGYYMLDGDGIVRNVNDNGLELLLLTKNRIIGRGFSKFIVKEDENKYFGALADAVKTSEDQELELIFKRCADLFRAKVKITPLYQGKGAKYGIIVEDITDCRKAEEVLKESDIKYSHLFYKSAVPAAFLSLPEVVIVDVNEALENLVGYSRQEMIGKTAVEIGIAKPKERKKQISRFERHGSLYQSETHISTKSGEERVVLINTNPLKLSGQQYAVSAIQDITERKKAEEKLRNSNKRYHEVVGAVRDGIAFHDPDGTITYVNQRMADMMGYSREEIIGRLSIDFVDTEESKSVIQTRSGLKNKESSIQEIKMLRKDGSVLWTLVNLFSRQDSADNFIGYLAMHTDITDRKKAEEKIKKLVEELIQTRDNLEEKIEERTKELELANSYNRSLIEANLDPLVTIGIDGKINDVNMATELITGYPRNKLIGTDFSNYFTEPSNAKSGYQQAFREGEVRDYPLEIKHKKGQLTPVLYHASVYKDEFGEVMGVFATARDITTQKEAEKQLKERTKELSLERQRLFDVLETVPIMICLLTPDYHVAFSNRAFREMYGESHGRHCYEYCFGLKEPCEFCESFKPFKTGKPHYWQLKSPNGKIIDAYDFPFTDIDGSQLVLEMDIDVTEQKQAEKDLKNTFEELKRSNEELKQFAYVSSHDLQEPLRTIASFTQLLERRYKGKFDSDADEFMDYIVEAAVHMKAQIEGLLEYSRVGTKWEEFQPVNLNEILNKIIQSLYTSIEESNAKINVDELPVVMGDAVQLQRVFQNLISNAIKFRKEEEPLEIRIYANKNIYGNGYVVSIEDNGIGIEKQYFERIFTIFQRLHTRDEYQGTGIGLSIVKRIIERHGGRVWVESEFGVGSVFYFTLPNL